MNRPRKALVALSVMAVVIACGAVALSQSPIGRAALRSRSHFIPSNADARVLLEPGMEAQAALIAESLKRALSSVEQQQFLRFKRPFNVYICATQESFNAYMGAPPGATARGVKLMNNIFIAPPAFSSWRGDTHEEVLAHELSHLHLYQRLGHVTSLWKMPVWFLEGLAVAVSGGGGEGVTTAAALDAIRHGEHFVPDDTGSLFRPKRALDYGLETFMFYKQSGLFVTYVRDRDPAAFKSFLIALQTDEWSSFGALFETSFGENVEAAGRDFVEHARGSERV